jgi:hypothetical protein
MPDHYDIIKDITNDEEETQDEISLFLSKIKNKYSNNTEQKHLNQMYDIGILVANKEFNKEKLSIKLTKFIDDRTKDTIRKVKNAKRNRLINAFKQGVEDGLSDEYRLAYNDSNEYQYTKEKLQKRAHIDKVLDNFNF